MIRSLLCTLALAAQLGAATASPVRSAQDDTLQTVLDGMARALGGREKLAALESVKTQYTLATSGLSGTGSTLVTKDGRERTSYDLSGVARGTTVFDGAAGWSLDQNGKVRALAGAELEAERSNAYFSSYSYLLPGRRPGKVALAGMDASGTHYVLTMTPDGGKPVTVHVDAKTFLVDRQEAPSDERVTTTTFSDWRDVDGVKFAFRSVQHTGPPEVTTYDLVVTVTDVKTNVPADASAFSKPAAGKTDFRFASGSSARDIPVELNGNHVFVQIRVNGSEPRWFIFDTGAEFTVVDSAVARELGLETAGNVEARGNGEGSMTASFVKGVTLSVPGAEVVDQTIVAIPLGDIAGFEGRHIDGIVGYDFTSRFVVELDYARRHINLFEPKSYAYSGSGQRLPIALVGNVPFVRATVEQPGAAPAEGLFLVDTGSRLSLSFNAPYVAATPWIKAAAEHALDAPYGIGVGGESKSRVGRVGRLKLGAYAIERPITGFAFDAGGATASKESIGAIGGDILRRFDVIFDYSRDEMILEPNASLGAPSEYDMLGALLRVDPKAGEGYVVHRIVAGSAAEAAGLRVGDRVVSIDGRSTSEIPFEEVRQTFLRDGTPVVLGVRRGETALELKPTLRRLV